MLTVLLVNEAIESVLPTARLLCKKYTWGPEGVVIVVGGDRRLPYITITYVMEELGPESEWQTKWDCNLREIAMAKMLMCLRTGHTSHDLITNMPWLLQKSDSKYRGGVAEDTSLAVGVSGVYEEIDETIAWLVFNTIAGLCLTRLRPTLSNDSIHTIPA